jgi:EAL domain-containing protein (putative c-di-GMP-specific phosphodiesterase class I)
MGRPRSRAQEQVGELLRTAKESLGMSLSFLTRMDGTTQTLEVVESSIPFVFKDGNTQPQDTSFCQAILDGRLPPVIPDVAALPQARRLPAARFPRIRSYVSVPVTLSDGTLYGTFCAAGFSSDRDLAERDRALMEVLARAASVIIEPEVQANARHEEIESRLRPVIADGGPLVVLQPIVRLGSGGRIGAEALSRFPAEWGKAPDVCFAEAHSIGLGHQLELLALHRAAAQLERVGGYVAMNLSPATVLTPESASLLGGLPAPRVLLELSEHDQVEDYDALLAALEPLRAAGMRLAVDDVGAGFSSLRHIVVTSPDVIKLDRSIVAGVADDNVLATLVGSLVDFAHGCRATVVAEGIETAVDAAALHRLGVDYGQGWHFGRPGPAEALTEVTAVEAAQAAPRGGPPSGVAPPRPYRSGVAGSDTGQGARTGLGGG